MRIALLLLLTSCCLCAQSQNFTNKGKEFWVGYGHNQFFSTNNSQEMVLYLSAEQPAQVTVSIPGTGFIKNYSIAANSVIVSDLIPKSGTDDCRLTGEGLFHKAVHVVSDVPIVAYAHMYGNTSSGAAMLLPVETYGYTYYSLNTSQNYDVNCYSWFYVVASENNTKVRITPAAFTMGGKQQDVPFDVSLNKGDIYNVLGYTKPNGNGAGNDMSGSVIQSIEGGDGHCHPITVFSGSSRTYVCSPALFQGGGDFMMQQVFPFTAWGTEYLAALTSSSGGADTLNTNRFRVYVRDPTTLVYNNGSLVTGLNNTYYDFSTSVSPHITATKPVMVAQLIPSATGCSTKGDGDPEIIFLSPIEQAIKKVSFYSTNKEAILANYITLVVPQQGIASLQIDGSNVFDTTYAHPGMAGYEVVVKKLPVTPAQHNVQCDTGFTAITYGLGFAESYGYNAGSYVNNLMNLTTMKNPNGFSSYTCPGTPVELTLETQYVPSSITWRFSQVAGFTPATDVVQNNPTPSGTTVLNGKTYNIYKCAQTATAPSPGTWYIPVTITAAAIDNCSHAETINVMMQVQPGPDADFTYAAICAGDTMQLAATSTDANIVQWQWEFADGATAATQQTKKVFATGGNYTAKVHAMRGADGCWGNATKTVPVNYIPAAQFDVPAVVCMPTGTAAFTNRSTLTGSTAAAMQYNWDFGDGGTASNIDAAHTYAAKGSYVVTLIAVSAAGCRDTTHNTVWNFADRPVADFDMSGAAVCAGTTIRFTDKSSSVGDAGTAQWKWNFGDGSFSTASQPDKSYKQDGSYTVSMNVTSGTGCKSDTVRKTVEIYVLPRVDAGDDVVTEPGRAVQLKGSVYPSSANIQWTPAGDLSAANILQPFASPLTNQRYYITATADHGCSSTDSVLVKVYKELKIPNAFTPNGDGRNDTWRIPGLDDYHNATVQVFNRWGQIVFRCTGYSRPWDGTMNGNQCPTGAYYYVIQPKENGYGALSGMVMIVR